MNWTQQFVVNISEDCTLTVTQASKGWKWEGNDRMAWHAEECWGEGESATLELAKASAEYWLKIGRFMRSK